MVTPDEAGQAEPRRSSEFRQRGPLALPSTINTADSGGPGGPAAPAGPERFSSGGALALRTAGVVADGGTAGERTEASDGDDGDDAPGLRRQPCCRRERYSVCCYTASASVPVSTSSRCNKKILTNTDKANEPVIPSRCFFANNFRMTGMNDFKLSRLSNLLT